MCNFMNKCARDCFIGVVDARQILPCSKQTKNNNKTETTKRNKNKKERQTNKQTNKQNNNNKISSQQKCAYLYCTNS